MQTLGLFTKRVLEVMVVAIMCVISLMVFGNVMLFYLANSL